MNFSNQNHPQQNPANTDTVPPQTANMNMPIHNTTMREGQPKTVNYGQAFVLFQPFSQVYNFKKALSAGTIFPELNLPYVWKGGANL